MYFALQSNQELWKYFDQIGPFGIRQMSIYQIWLMIGAQAMMLAFAIRLATERFGRYLIGAYFLLSVVRLLMFPVANTFTME